MDALTSALGTYIGDFELKIDNLPDVDENSIQEQIAAFENEIRKTERKLSKLFDSWEDGIIDNNEFVQRKEVFNLKIDAIKRQIEYLKKNIEKIEFSRDNDDEFILDIYF